MTWECCVFFQWEKVGSNILDVGMYNDSVVSAYQKIPYYELCIIGINVPEKKLKSFENEYSELCKKYWEVE